MKHASTCIHTYTHSSQDTLPLFHLQAEGEGLTKAFTAVPAEFTIDAVKAGLHTSCDLTVTIGNDDAPIEPSVTDAGDGKYKVIYTASKAKDHLITIQYKGMHIAGSPFRATVLENPDVSKCEAEGNCLEPGADIFNGDPLDIAVATCDAGEGKLRASAVGPGGNQLPVFLAEQEDGKVMARVNTNDPGDYLVNIFWNESHIPRSPFKLTVLRRLTAADIKVGVHTMP